MRTLAVAITLLAFLMTQANGQAGSSRILGKKSKPHVEETAPKVDEKAYNEALKRIPEPKEKYDPWGGARPSAPNQKQSK